MGKLIGKDGKTMAATASVVMGNKGVMYEPMNNYNEKYTFHPTDVLNIGTEENPRYLHRLVSLGFEDADGNTIPYGTLGGYIEKETNLNPVSSCWVYGNAIVLGKKTHINGDVKIQDNAIVGDRCDINGECVIMGNAVICGSEDKYTYLRGNVTIGGDVTVERSQIKGKWTIYGGATLRDVQMTNIGDMMFVNLDDTSTVLQSLPSPVELLASMTGLMQEAMQSQQPEATPKEPEKGEQPWLTAGVEQLKELSNETDEMLEKISTMLNSEDSFF